MIKRKKIKLFSYKVFYLIKNIPLNTILRPNERYIYCTYVHKQYVIIIIMRRILLFVTALFLASALQAQTEPMQFSVATYNVDGLPPSLTALGINIKINPEGPQAKYTKVIAEKLMEKSWDIIGLNEDFNYHDVLTGNISGYQVMTHGGKFESSTAAALGILLRTFRFKTDGLGLLVKEPMKAYNEVIQPWKECYGYLDHDNDSLTQKGFRHYEVDVNEKATIDVIVLHADAYDAEPDRLAREKQMTQLMDYVETNKHCNHPLVIMGDYNQMFGKERLEELVLDRLNNNKSLTACDACMEYSKEHPDTNEEIDKIIFVNNEKCDYQLVLNDFGNGYDFLRDDGTALSDHWPAYATFEIVDNVITGISETTAVQPSAKKRIVGGRIVIERNGKRCNVAGEEL